MAKFVGTVQEFHHYIGPKLKNAINQTTRNHRSQRNGICEVCEAKAELQSAHVHGRERRVIIEQALRESMDENGMVSCLLEEVESKILQAHLPIEQTFKFICQMCHTRYDSGGLQPKNGLKRPMNPTSIDGDFLKLSRIKRWAVQPHQINHKIVRAFLDMESNGEVERSNLRRYCTDILHVLHFDGNFAQMKTDAGNAHGKVFFDEGLKVKMWNRVRKEVDAHFGRNSSIISDGPPSTATET